MQSEIQKNPLLSSIIAIELVAVSSPYYLENTCHSGRILVAKILSR